MHIIYYIKGLLSIFTSPLLIILSLILMSIYFTIKNKVKLTIRLMGLTFTILLLFSSSPISNFLSKQLELQYASLKIIPKDVKFIILLGGEFNKRIYEVINLHNKIPNSKIILFGKDSSYNFTEAKDQYNILLNMGVSRENVVLNSIPVNTREEIKAIKQMLKHKDSFIIVTNAIHMPRVMLLCKYYNLNAIASPTNYYTKHSYKTLGLPSAKNLHQSTLAIHEYIGLLYEQALNII